MSNASGSAIRGSQTKNDRLAWSKSRTQLSSDGGNHVLNDRWTAVRTLPLVARAMVSLLVFDLVASIGGYKRVNAMTRRQRVKQRMPHSDTIDIVCWAVEEACVWYPKRALCLQRSTVAAWTLRRRGVPAELVIGYRPMPIDSHAWVEVGGRVVNDRPQYQKFYQVMDRL